MGLGIDSETITSWLNRGQETLGDNAGEISTLLSGVATGMNPAAGVFLGVAGTMSAGLLQDKTVEVGAELDRRLKEQATELEDSEDTGRARVGRGLRALARCLPDGDQWEESLVQSMNGDPSDLVALLETYQQDEKRRRQYERAVEAVITGDVDDQLGDDEDFLDYLQAQFDADDRNDALTTFLDVQDLLTAREVHETLQAVHGIEFDLQRIETQVQATNEKLDALLDARFLNDGFQRLGDRNFRLQGTESDIETVIQRGFKPADVAAGLAVERPVELRESAASEDREERQISPAEATKYLAEEVPGQSLLVQGRPGSGKTTFCLSVAHEWYRADHGAVVYRESGGLSIDDPGDIVSELARADGQVLVVINDPVRADGNLELIETYEDEYGGEDVTFLLNCRFGEFDPKSAGRGRDTDVQRSLRNRLETIPKAEMVPLDESSTGAVIEHFERETGEEFNHDGESLYNSIETRSRAGEMLLVTFRLFGEGLRSDARAKYAALEAPAEEDVRNLGLEAFDRDLCQTVGLFVNLLNLAENVEVRREYLYALALADEDVTFEDVERLLAALEGWLFFTIKSEPLLPQHELWSFLYLDVGIERATDDGEDEVEATPSWAGDEAESESESDDETGPGATTMHRQFETCLDALFAVLEGSEQSRWAELVERSSGIDVLADIDDDPESEAVRLVEALFEIGKEYPVLEPIVRASEDALFSLADWDTCPSRAVAAASIARGGMLETLGRLDKANEAYKRARWYLDESDETRETRAEALLGQGDVQRTRGEFDEAQESYSEARALVARDSGDNETEVVARCLGKFGAVVLSRGDLDQAQEHHEDSLDIARDIGDRQAEATSLNDLGNVAWSRGELDQAQQYYEDSLDIFRDIGGRQGEAASLGNLGTVARSRGDLNQAQEHHEDSLAIKRDIGDRQGEAASLGNLGLVARSRGNLDQAQQHYEDSLDIFRDIGDRQGAARSLNNLGNVAGSRGNLDQAQQYYQDSLAIQRDIGDRQGEAANLGNLGLVAGSRGNLDQAQEHHEDSLAIKRDIGDRQGEAASLNNLGLVAESRGDLDQAQRYHEDSLDIFRDIGDRQGEAQSIGNLGNVAGSRGDLDQAQQYHEDSLDIKRDIGDQQGEAQSIGNLGNVAESRGDLDQAQQYYQDSLAIQRDIGDRQGEAASLNNLGLVAESRGDLDQAQQYHEDSLAIQRDIGDRHGEAASLNNLGNVAGSRGDLDQAQQYHEDSLAIFRDIGVWADATTSLRNLVEVYGEDVRVEDARGWWQEGEDLRQASGGTLSVDDIRPVNVAYARIDAREPSDRLPELFYWGLHASRDGNLATMGQTHAEAWTLREDIDESSDAYDVVLAAGVSVLALDELFCRGDGASGIEDVLDDEADVDPDTVRRTLAEESGRLPLASSAVFEYFADGETDTEPEQLRNLASGIDDDSPRPPQAALVNGEFGRLLHLLQQGE